MGYTREMAIEDDGLDSVVEWELQEVAWAEESYQEAEKEQGQKLDRKFCSQCQRLLVYNSLAYDEGYHFDSCY